MKKPKIYDNINKFLLIFLLVQPLCDIYMLLVGEKWDVFGISIVTLFRTITVVTIYAIVAFSQIKYKYKLKFLYISLTYLLLVFTYVFLHHLNIISFDTYYIKTNSYNAITEAMYALRLLIPVLLMYAIVLTRPNKKQLENIILIVVAIISVTIILTNVFKVSIASYSPGNNKITYNFLEWFTNSDLHYRKTLSKGLFVSANQIGALLVILLPIVIYKTLKSKSIISFIVLLLQIISMVLVGTRVASYGWMFVAVSLIIVYITLIILKIQSKPSLQSILIVFIIFAIGVFLYSKSPANNREFASSYEGMYQENVNGDLNTQNFISIEEFDNILKSKESMINYVGSDTEDIRYNAMCKYIEENYMYHYITEKYIKQIYPYQDDPEFWVELFKEPVSYKGDSRAREVAIIKRIKDNNNNLVLDTLLGVGATPLNNREYMIENDLISHYYNLGIVGTIIFILPYISGIGYSIYLNRKRLLSLCNIHFAVYVQALVVAYFVGFFAGHVLDEYIVSLFIAIISGIIFNYYNKEGEINEQTKT